MSTNQPSVVVLAGPNGAGKTTASPFVIRDTLGINEFVNADHIAQGLSGFAPETSAFAAGRIMLERLHELGRLRRTFAFETTLATRSFAPWMKELKGSGYSVQLVFLALPSPELAIQRVRHRVSQGGHDVPPDVVRRRFQRGLRNLFHIYIPLSDYWAIYDATGDKPQLVQSSNDPSAIYDTEFLKNIQR